MFRGQIEQVIESSPMSKAPAMKCARVRDDADAPSSVSRTGLETQGELPHKNTELNNPMPRFYDETKRRAPEPDFKARRQSFQNESVFLSRLLYARSGTSRLCVPQLPSAIPGVAFIPKMEYESLMIRAQELAAAHSRTMQAQTAEKTRTTADSPVYLDQGMAESRQHGDRLHADCPIDHMAASDLDRLRYFQSKIRQRLSLFWPLEVVIESSNEAYMVLLVKTRPLGHDSGQ